MNFKFQTLTDTLKSLKKRGLHVNKVSLSKEKYLDSSYLIELEILEWDDSDYEIMGGQHDIFTAVSYEYANKAILAFHAVVDFLKVNYPQIKLKAEINMEVTAGELTYPESINPVYLKKVLKIVTHNNLIFKLDGDSSLKWTLDGNIIDTLLDKLNRLGNKLKKAYGDFEKSFGVKAYLSAVKQGLIEDSPLQVINILATHDLRKAYAYLYGNTSYTKLVHQIVMTNKGLYEVGTTDQINNFIVRMERDMWLHNEDEPNTFNVKCFGKAVHHALKKSIKGATYLSETHAIAEALRELGYINQSPLLKGFEVICFRN